MACCYYILFVNHGLILMSVSVFNPRTDDAAVATPAGAALLEPSAVQANTVVKKVFITTQGCQMNVYDSDKMLDVLGDSHGMQVTHNIDEADVLLMNTCSIREKAQEKVFSELGRWRKLKEKRPDLVIGVGGCVASQEGDNIQKRAPYVDMVFGPQTLHRLPELYDQSHEQRDIAPKNRIGTVDVSFPSIEKFDFYQNHALTGLKPLSLLWKAAQNTAHSASYLTRAVKNCRDLLMMCWLKLTA